MWDCFFKKIESSVSSNISISPVSIISSQLIFQHVVVWDFNKAIWNFSGSNHTPNWLSYAHTYEFSESNSIRHNFLLFEGEIILSRRLKPVLTSTAKL